MRRFLTATAVVLALGSCGSAAGVEAVPTPTTTTAAITHATTTTSLSEPASAGGPDLCERGSQIDVNGDGQPDRVSTYGRAGDVGSLAVCAADGNVSDVRAIPLGDLEAFASFVLNRGEPAIFIPMHTAATYATGSLLTFVGGRIKPITDSETGLQVGVDDGRLADPSMAAKWGCLDVDGDGRRDLVTVRITADGWTRTAYSIDGTSAHRLATSSGSLPEGSTVENAWGDNGRYARIAPPCGSP
jgi:hypothetical protein